MLLFSFFGRIIQYMEQATTISKAAFLALLNSGAKRVAVDTEYDRSHAKTRLVILYNNGDREIFKGLRAA